MAAFSVSVLWPSYKGFKGPEHMFTDTFKPFQGLPFGRLKTAQTRKLHGSEVTA